ncbi:hypothetical protein AAVH_40379, partial [Aphelenchoides avenae]
QCPNATAGTIEDACKYACGCSCIANPATYLACRAYCTTQLSTQVLCQKLVDALPSQTGVMCPVGEYTRASVCEKICACCNVPLTECSCANSPELLAIRETCDFAGGLGGR